MSLPRSHTAGSVDCFLVSENSVVFISITLREGEAGEGRGWGRERVRDG